MTHIFKQESKYFPIRWFIVILAFLASMLSYADTTGWRLMSFSGSKQPAGYQAGSHYYHK